MAAVSSQEWVMRGQRLERENRVHLALDAYLHGEAWDEAARLLSHLGRFREAGETLLFYLDETPTPAELLSGFQRRKVMDASLCFVRAGAREEALGLLQALGENARAAALLKASGRREEAVAAMRGRELQGTPWPGGLLRPISVRPPPPTRRQLEAFERRAAPREPEPIEDGELHSVPPWEILQELERLDDSDPRPKRLEAPPDAREAADVFEDFSRLTAEPEPVVRRLVDDRPPPHPDPMDQRHELADVDSWWEDGGGPTSLSADSFSLSIESLPSLDTPPSAVEQPLGAGRRDRSPAEDTLSRALEEPPPPVEDPMEDPAGEPSSTGFVLLPDAPEASVVSGEPPRTGYRRIQEEEVESLESSAEMIVVVRDPEEEAEEPAEESMGVLLLGKGAVVDDRYAVEEFIGAGAMAAVFRAVDLELGGKVALKIFRMISGDRAGLERFRREMRLSRRLNHPALVRIYEFGTWQGTRYISMELLEGRDMRKLLKERGRLPVSEVLRLALQVCDGLAAVHEAGIVHRDVKPENLFLVDRDRRVKLMDFGIAKATETSTISITGVRVGTPRYMSPEQIQGAADVGPPSDLYALGGLMFEALTGRPVFRAAELMPLLMKHLTEPPVAPSAMGVDVPEDVDALVLRLLEKRPQDRYPDCGALRPELVAAYLRHKDD